MDSDMETLINKAGLLKKHKTVNGKVGKLIVAFHDLKNLLEVGKLLEQFENSLTEMEFAMETLEIVS